MAVALGSAYIAVALLELIPKSNERVLTIASGLIFLLFAGLFVTMLRMRRQRSRKKREWLAKDADPPRDES